MDREEALELLARLHRAQNSFYSGGDEGELRTLLAPDITWHVPGRNLIAGTYRGHESRPTRPTDSPAAGRIPRPPAHGQAFSAGLVRGPLRGP
jgi:ketosteroid isomerase-like protein